MEPFLTLSSPALPLDASNVDTDQVIPARFLSKPRQELGLYMFHDVRFDESGAPRQSPFNDPAYRGARILVTRENFGCGSSREGAVWALMGQTASDEGDDTHAYRCVIAPSYGEIFYSNACKNGLLPVRLPSPIVVSLLEQLKSGPGGTIAVDLEAQTVVGPDGAVHSFEFDAFQRDCLLRGLEDVELTSGHASEIDAFERRRAADIPWVLAVER